MGELEPMEEDLEIMKESRKVAEEQLAVEKRAREHAENKIASLTQQIPTKQTLLHLKASKHLTKHHLK